MSNGQLSRHRSTSESSHTSKRSQHSNPPPYSAASQRRVETFEPCTSSPSFFLYAQRTIILCLHHDTLAAERRFEGHKEDVQWIAVDNVSERGFGRLVVSYDAGQTAIVWDLFTGDQISRFAAYEPLRVATWMRNGNVAFGNSQGNVILFEPSTSEHVSVRTIYDPITALAPAGDLRTYAIGYQNGSILIACLQPSFTILHTLITPRPPSTITGLAWHSSSSKSKSEMLAAQTADGDLRVWSIPKIPNGDPPKIIRMLNRADSGGAGPHWFAWSKNGRIVQYSNGETRAWDVRTKNVTHEPVPTIEGITAITNYGPTATMFTLGRNHTVQQYDLANSPPMLVANVQHVPANAPPSPPNSIEEEKDKQRAAAAANERAASGFASQIEPESSEDEGSVMSPLQRIAREMDQLHDERRDLVGPLSPVSSKASVSSRSSDGGHRQVRQDKFATGRTSVKSGYSGTAFSAGSSIKTGHESISIRSFSSAASSQPKSSNLRHQIFRSPDTPSQTGPTDLFPMVKARLSVVEFRPPKYDPSHNTPDSLRIEMLSTVFGWDDDIESLIRDEVSHHLPGSASAVLLSKWLGASTTDVMASMPGTESMTSSDWMLLALSAMGHDSQKKVGEAFVQRLLEKGDIHPAVAILLGLGEQNEAVEVYVSQKYYMEAVLLTCLFFPNDWQRQSYLVRKWGEVAVKHGSPELAVRCFSCTSIQSSEPWFSPRAQGEVFAAQQQQHHALAPKLLTSPISPASAGRTGRMTTKNSSLKLITSFGDNGAPQLLSHGGTQLAGPGVTPIAESALSPGGDWLRPSTRSVREPSSARTATPGSCGRRRLPSTGRTPRTALPESTPRGGTTHGLLPTSAHPGTARHDQRPTVFPHGRSASQGQATAPLILSSATYEPSNAGDNWQHNHKSGALPSPAHGVFDVFRETPRNRNGSRDRKPDNLHLHVHEAVVVGEARPSSERSSGWDTKPSRPKTPTVDESSPYPETPNTGKSVKNSKGRSIDRYISSLEEANYNSRRQRAESRSRGESSSARSHPGPEEPTAAGRSGVHYVRPAQRSPSSPIPMSPNRSGEDSTDASFDDERYYGIASPVESAQGRASETQRAERSKLRARSGSRTSRQAKSPGARPNLHLGSRAVSRGSSRATSRQRSPGEAADRDARGRFEQRQQRSKARSPSSPVPMVAEARSYGDARNESTHEVEPLRPRQRSTSHCPDERGTSERRQLSPAEGFSRAGEGSVRSAHDQAVSLESQQSGVQEAAPPRMDVSAEQPVRARAFSRKELAARELEERRLSLARRPSVPAIPQPGEPTITRPRMSPRSETDLGNSPVSYLPPVSSLSARGITRSQSTEPETMMRHAQKTTGTCTSSTRIGLPATPRAMRHPRYMSSDPNEREAIATVPELPDNHDMLASITQHQNEKETDQLAPLLPSTVFGQKSLPARSASAPPQQISDLQHHAAAFPAHAAFKPDVPASSSRRGSLNRGHARKISASEVQTGPPNQSQISPSPFIASIDETINNDDQVVIIGNHEPDPPLLPQLQHLATPPPPPPPPSMFRPGHSRTTSASGSSVGVINIVMDDILRSGTPASRGQTPVIDVSVGASPTDSPNPRRRSRGSITEGTPGSSISGRLRHVRERMRSTSRSRNKSPPLETFTPSPYETVLPPFPFPRRESMSRQQDGLNIQNMPQTSSEQMMSSPQPAPIDQAEQIARSNKIFGPGYRHPREIRANMPPELLQLGVTQMNSNSGI